MSTPTLTPTTGSTTSRPRFRLRWYGWTAWVVGLASLAAWFGCEKTLVGGIIAAVFLAGALVATFAAIGRVCSAV